MTPRDMVIKVMDETYAHWAEHICDGEVTPLMADALIKSGLIVDETVYSPIVLLEKDMGILDFICPKCNKIVSMVELSTIGNPCIAPQPKIEEVKKLSQVHYKYCMYCGAKLKE